MKKHTGFLKKNKIKIDREHTTPSFIIVNEIINFVEVAQSLTLSFIPFTQVATVDGSVAIK